MIRLAMVLILFLPSSLVMAMEEVFPTSEDQITASFGRISSVFRHEDNIAAGIKYEFLSEVSKTRFGLSSHNHTLERSYKFRVRGTDRGMNHWQLELGSFSTGQNIEAAFIDIPFAFRRHRAFYVQQDWTAQLLGGLEYRFFLGTSRCENVDNGTSRFVPIMGAGLAGKADSFSWAIELGQNMRGNSFRSGLYGGEVSQALAIDSSYRWTDQLSMEVFCELAMHRKASEEKNMLREAPAVVAGISFSFQIQESLLAKVGYSHRNHFGNSENQRRLEGPMGHVTIDYSFF